MSDMDCDLVMESIKTEETMIGEEKYTNSVKVEKGFDRMERRRRECKNCELMKSTYTSLKDRCASLIKENDSLEKNNTELEEINGSLYLSLQTVQHEKEKFVEMCNVSHSSSGRQENVYYKHKFIFLNDKYDTLRGENNTNITEIENLREKLAELHKQLDFKDQQLNKSRMRFSKMNQEYLALKLKYGEDEGSVEEAPSYKQVQVARNEICASSYVKKKSPSLTKSASDDMTLLCQLCFERFPTRTSLRSHTGHCRRRISGNDLSFTNKATRAQSPSPYKSKVPTKSSGPCICPFCDREFARPCNLGRHMKVHSDELN